MSHEQVHNGKRQKLSAGMAVLSAVSHPTFMDFI